MASAYMCNHVTPDLRPELSGGTEIAKTIGDEQNRIIEAHLSETGKNKWVCFLFKEGLSVSF